MQVANVMSPSVDLADPNMELGEVATKMRQDDIGALPVGENDRLVGMVTDRDIIMRCIAEQRPSDGTTVRDVMSQGIFYCFEDQTLEEAAKVMAEHQVHRLPVLNRDKRLVGIVALADLARGPDGRDAAMEALTGICQATGQPRR